MKKLFGTDGIRGKANIFPITGEIALMLGRVVTWHFQSLYSKKRPLIILGKDTRRSCYMLEQAFSAGVCSQGGEVILTGPLPTPGVAYLTQSMRANAGVMISASHNPFMDNGIKIFDHQGRKLSDEVEMELEKMILGERPIPPRTGNQLGWAKRLDEVSGRYVVQIKSLFNKKYSLENFKIVLDSAHGAAYKVAPMIFSELGADVYTLGDSPNGENINRECGTMHPETIQAKLKELNANLGICLDGDGDRLILIDEMVRVVDGDRIIGILAKLMLDQGKIRPGDAVVGSVMSNLGLEMYIRSLGLEFRRTQVGDRYIMEEINKVGARLGGEPSGHIICHDDIKTGDGCLSALKVIEAMMSSHQTLGDLAHKITLYPQKIKNIPVQNKIPLESMAPLQKTITKIKKELNGKGRIILRYSGTEPLARIMVEAQDWQCAEKYCNQLSETVLSELNQ